jgi:hypothetical protein
MLLVSRGWGVVLFSTIAQRCDVGHVIRTVQLNCDQIVPTQGARQLMQVKLPKHRWKTHPGKPMYHLVPRKVRDLLSGMG